MDEQNTVILIGPASVVSQILHWNGDVSIVRGREWFSIVQCLKALEYKSDNSNEQKCTASQLN